MNPIKNFENEVKCNIKAMGDDRALLDKTLNWIENSAIHKYSYNFKALGRPIIQYPQDIVMMQEIIWSVKPDLIIETGIAHGGSLVMNASMLALLDICEAIESGNIMHPENSKRKVLGIDIDLRHHNAEELKKHPMSSRIQIIQGSSVDLNVIQQVNEIAKNYKRVLVCLDSNHTHKHVLAELNAYAPLVSIGSYCIIFDTIIEDLPKELFPDRPWGPGDNPKTAVWDYLRSHTEFAIDKEIQKKLLITVAPDGFLKRTS